MDVAALIGKSNTKGRFMLQQALYQCGTEAPCPSPERSLPGHRCQAATRPSLRHSGLRRQLRSESKLELALQR